MGFTPANFGRIALDMEAFIPATPFGIMELLKRYEVPTKGKHVVVVGRSHIVVDLSVFCSVRKALKVMLPSP